MHIYTNIYSDIQAVREERMGVLNKKQKSEEDKMRTNEESFNTQVP